VLHCAFDCSVANRREPNAVPDGKRKEKVPIWQLTCKGLELYVRFLGCIGLVRVRF